MKDNEDELAKEPIKPHTQIILMKMFEGTGHTYSDEFVKTNDWYLTHSWTPKEEKEFVDWLTEYLYDNSGAREEIMRVNSKNKQLCKMAAQNFCAWFGWTTTKVEKE